MYLKTLTLKGFKSFAEPTSIEMEHGVTVVVGPNGSGKSNIVDAVAWVLGAQGPKVVRSQKMDDVIFAGSGKRPALGRAEVSLTIDNSSRLLPVDLNEITITRVLFRSGDSEYALNGVPCRLLDIQEMLSDSGVGRTQHVIVGQGQLDSVLNSKPEERRAIIEEAAGVLKYRKRRERAERRLEATHGDLQRLQDLLAEVRRSMRPLQRQADAARRHGAIASELAELRLYLAGREITQLSSTGESLARTRDAAIEECDRLGRLLRDLDIRVSQGESTLDALRVFDLSPVVGSLAALRERAMGTARVIEERRRSLAQAEEVVRVRQEAGRRLQSEREELSAELEEVRRGAEEAVSRLQEVQGEVDRSEEALLAAESEFRSVEGDHQRWAARAEALGQAMTEARARAGAGKLQGVVGVLGALAEVVEVDEGWELAFEAAAGEVAGAVVVASTESAREALERFADDDEGGAVVVGSPTGASPAAASSSGWIDGLPAGVETLRSHVRSLRPGIERLLDALLERAVCVEGGWSAAFELARARPDLVVVSRVGDRFAGGFGRVGAGGTGASLAALEAARVEESAAEARSADMREALEGLRSVNRNQRAAAEEAAHEAARSSERVRLIEERLASMPPPGLDQPAVQVPSLPAAAALHLERLASVVRSAISEAEDRLASLSASQETHARRLQEAMASLEAARRERSSSEGELSRSRERLQRAEIDLAENRLRRESAVESLRRDLDSEPEAAAAAICPELPPGMSARQRARELERELKLLGPINPLALEELNALQERHDFLSSQMEDVKSARRELIKVLRAVDAEIQQVFGEAFEDVSDNFTALFDTLFPGGTGRLVLTDPSNLLETGVEVEARPAGKRVNKLSLLSGGERALTALAFLFAVFRSRPSPFYILDEVEAALDDVSLDRFLGLVDEFRREAQLIIVSHQKRTMEQADSLYGVSIAPGGSSKVISERLRPPSASTTTAA